MNFFHPIGERFMVSPCGFLADWFKPEDIAARAADWTDCTDMPDGEMDRLMTDRMNNTARQRAAQGIER